MSAVDNIVSGAGEITQAVEQVTNLSIQNKELIDSIYEKVNWFKTRPESISSDDSDNLSENGLMLP